MSALSSNIVLLDPELSVGVLYQYSRQRFAESTYRHTVINSLDKTAAQKSRDQFLAAIPKYITDIELLQTKLDAHLTSLRK